MRSFGFVAASLGLAGMAWASGAGSMPAGTQELISAFPNVKVSEFNGQIRALYGTKMTAASTPAQAAEWWMADHADAFGIDNVELNLESSMNVNPKATWTVFKYQQTLDGVPVEFGTARLLVSNGSPSTVILATGRLTASPDGGFAADAVDADAALEIAQAAYDRLNVWGTPSLVIYSGLADSEDPMTPVRAWKVRGENTLQGDGLEMYHVFVNAADGAVVYTRNEIYEVDVTGDAHGMATPYLPKNAMYPDDAQNLPIDQILEGSQAGIGATLVTVGQDGTFVIPNVGETDVTVTGKLIHPHLKVLDASSSPEILVSQLVTPPGPVDLFYNAVPIELDTAELNGFIHSVNEYDFVLERAPAFTGFDTQTLTVSVNQNSSCNATYGGNQTNFYIKAGGCPNTAYSSVVAHEMGHYLVEKLGLAQNAFGEGTSDAIGNMMYNDPMTGRDFLAEGQILRDPVAANKQYPCSDAIHECGMVLSGIWWDIHLNLGEDVMLPTTQQLYIDWMMITNGEQDSTDGMGPVSVPEVLGVADDDGNPETPGPFDDAICGAFVKHGIVPCGDVTLLNIEFVNIDPATLTGLPCDVENKFCLKITDGSIGTLDPSTVEMIYRNVTDGGTKITVPMPEINPDIFEGTLPAAASGKRFLFWFQAKTTDGILVTVPVGAPQNRFDLTTDCAVPALPSCDAGTPCEGDVNGDGIIDPLDSGYSLSRFGCSVGTGDAECDAADANLDGVVDPLDTGYILSRFGVCP